MYRAVKRFSVIVACSVFIMATGCGKAGQEYDKAVELMESGKYEDSLIIYRLGLSADVLFYPEMPKIEQQTKQLLCKFAACTEEERAFLLKTLDCMVEQMQDQHKNENKNIK